MTITLLAAADISKAKPCLLYLPIDVPVSTLQHSPLLHSRCYGIGC